MFDLILWVGMYCIYEGDDVVSRISYYIPVAIRALILNPYEYVR